MKVVSNANATAMSLLKRFKKTASENRMNRYCVQAEVDDGILLFNLLTREIVLLSSEEYERRTELEELKERFFVLPEQSNEKEYVDFIRWFLTNQKKKSNAITGYTIFPTMDCNARCFYCYELGRSRVPMSHETALKVVEYIKAHCGGKEIAITWFGGEPLYNLPAIDTICEGLRKEGVSFYSAMISNAYLFDEITVKKAVESWNLKRIQITLDGTEEVYNRVKAFIYQDGNPYHIVLSNMERLLDAGVQINVRMNMDMHNADNLLLLVDELVQRFGGREGLTVYARHLFKGNQPTAKIHSEEEWELRETAMKRIERKLHENGLETPYGISKKIKLHQCMADSGTAVTILPDGHIGVCQHHSEAEFIGHIDQEGFDSEAVAEWKETVAENDECGTCFYYPDCFRLKKCSNQSICYPQYRQERERDIQKRMVFEYKQWKKQNS